MFDYNIIKENLKTKYIGQTFVQFDEIDSTNIKAKSISNNCPEGMIVLTERQTAGKGRLGRTWQSPENKNIYMSVILKPESEPQNAVKLTQIAAAAVSKSLEEIEIDNKIKWPNDIFCDGKKACGILCEMSIKNKEINSIIVGIGVNVNMDEKDFTDEIKDKAISLKLVSNKVIVREMLIAIILNNLEKLYEELKETSKIEKTLKICREKSLIIGNNIEINKIGRKTVKKVKVIDITENGELLVENKKGEKEIVISGEVSIRSFY